MSGENQSYGPGFLGFVVVFLLAVAVYLLLRNMTMRLRRLRYTPGPAQEQTPSSRTDGSPDAAPPAADGPPARSGEDEPHA